MLRRASLLLYTILSFGFSASAVACSPSGTTPGRDVGPADGGGGALPTISVSGRVVDLESCFEGCDGVADVVVAWAGAPDVIRSAPSGGDGGFLLEGVPSGIRSDLLAIPQGSAGARFATTLNPMVLSRDDTSDVFSLQVSVMARDELSLIAAFETATGIRLDRDGGYIGQVVTGGAGGVFDPAMGIDVAHAPTQGPIRYVGALPRLSDEEAFPAGATATSIFGLFVLGGSQRVVDPVTFAPGSAEMPFDTIVTPLIPGVVSYGLHRAR